VDSRTPNPYGDRGKTPAWSVSSKMPNPYTDGRTPGWSERTPALNSGSKTLNPSVAVSGSTSWGNSTLARNPGWGNTLGSSSGTAGGWGDDWSTSLVSNIHFPTSGLTNIFFYPGCANASGKLSWH
jgi:transcription elongation factor SPT5